jgi:hypothetical protein
MIPRVSTILLPVALALFAAEDPAWKTKPIPEWTPDDAHQVLSDSPWTKTVTPSLSRATNEGQRGPGSGRRGGGIGIDFPGGGIGRRYPGGGYPGGGSGRPEDGADRTNGAQPPKLTVRWESALPVREAELKTRDTFAPTVEEGQYAIAVYGVPNRMANADSKSFADKLKGEAVLKRDGKKDIKPSKVEVLQREDGPLIVYFFSRSKEITQPDRRVEFDAKIGRLEFTQSFFLDDMVYQGKLEL